MGSATTICSDKTRTLTTDHMTVVKACICEQAKEVNGNKTEILGTPTKTALLEFGSSLGGDFQEVRQASNVVRVEPFNSTKKRMRVVIEVPEGHFWAHCKGASEIVLDSCDKYINKDGEVVSLDEESTSHLKNIIEEFASEALQTLCLAYFEIGDEFSLEARIPSGQ
ncbi:calcium-transporting ATPase 1, chloroplastic [Arabidopsis lyrata subsp. lyrata]|uniref:calcium-transporting ATPase 1, chloroplastic n=1 Tax=Arabidopsis lyrata subsp. lyrata TaxID=81972 RepID=UPI000A29D419|nr:calcium-transporting ATPase 1, chloroplastic [Arabidopsis lyrata subsp. lyrata]|eukprot:XP_020871440.1 calcium-transporting ATPase 1, chloroplastic [Arabidopsis lyrata subsp. lyrata]